MCNCAETRFVDRNGLTRMVSPIPAGHSCQYVVERNKLIEGAAATATMCYPPTRRPGSRETTSHPKWNALYTSEMERRAREAGLVR